MYAFFCIQLNLTFINLLLYSFCSNIYYPLNCASGLIKGSFKDKNFEMNFKVNQLLSTNIIWMNQTNGIYFFNI
jgi:hypothetical protein